MNPQPEVRRMKIDCKFKTAHYYIIILCHYVMIFKKSTLVTLALCFQIKLTRIHTSLLGYCSSSTGYKSEKLVSDSPRKGGMIGTVYPNIPLSSANQ